MLADKTASYEDELRQMQSAKDKRPGAPAAAPAAPITVIPARVPEALAEIAARAEALAAQIEDMV
jgi:cell division protein ZapA